MARIPDSKRPRTPEELRKLIRVRRDNIRVLEAALKVRHPADVRKIMLQRLHGEKMNLQSLEDFLRRTS